MREHRERLDRLSKAHLVPDDHLALDEGEPGAEALIATQRCGQVLGVKFEPPYGLDDFVRKISVCLLLVFGDEAQFGEQREVIGWLTEEVIPRIARLRGATRVGYLAGETRHGLH